VPSIEEIRRIKEEVEADLLKRPGVQGVDVGYKYVGGQKTGEIAIRVLVAEKKDVPARQAVPKEIQGVKTDVIERRIVLHQFESRVPVAELEIKADTGTYDPLKGGISIGPCRAIGGFVYTGTLGAVVRDNATGNPMLLSNFHVMCVDDAWSVGDTMTQPSRVDTGTCPGGVVGSLQRAVLGGQVDAAVSSHSARGTACEIVDIGAIDGTAAATLGMAVRKRGRTTGLTYGTVDSISLTVTVDYGDGLGNVTLTNQIGIDVDSAQSTQFGNKGDSGSVVVDGSRRVVGLYFAGSEDGSFGVANPIAAVLSALDVTMCQPTLKIKEGGKREFKEGKREFKEFLKRELKELRQEKLTLKDFQPEKYFLPKEGKPEKEIYEGKSAVREDFPIDFPIDTGGPFGGFGAGTLEERVARLEAVSGLVPQAGGDPACVEFETMPQGNVPNPFVAPNGTTFTAFDHTGAPTPSGRIWAVGGPPHVGLDCGFTLEIKPPQPCPAVELKLLHMAQPATIEAFDSGGGLLGNQVMGPTQAVPQSFKFSGGVALVRVRAPSDETILLEFCCRDGKPKEKPEKEKPEKEKPEKEKREKEKAEKFEKVEKPEKEKREKEKLEKLEKREKLEKPEKEKREKEKIEKVEKREKPEKPEKEKRELEKPELKLEGEKLELRDKPDFKFETEKAQTFDKFEPEGGPGPFDPGSPLGATPGLEARLARLEAALAQLTHFIDPEQRPDLSGGALGQEPDVGW